MLNKGFCIRSYSITLNAKARPASKELEGSTDVEKKKRCSLCPFFSGLD